MDELCCDFIPFNAKNPESDWKFFKNSGTNRVFGGGGKISNNMLSGLYSEKVSAFVINV